ncbi:MAG: polysaccharide biosynthesis tyrosine autokinase [Omnitrophica bacterium]|nr:polysaccharide biosynthesis tyrosine autokinase [Candidatus Omnitrophota bacterium]
MIPPADVKELTLIDYVQIVLKRIWILIACLGIIGGFGIYKTFSTVKVYETEATIFIKREALQFSGKVDRNKGGIPSKEAQLLLLSSRLLAKRVIDKLNLLNDSEFIESKDPVRKIISMVRIDEKKEGNIVNVIVTGKDPLKISKIANAWVKGFVEEDIDMRIGATIEGLAWLRKQVAITLVELEESEKELNVFVKKNRIDVIPEVGTTGGTVISSLKEQKAQLEKQLIEIRKIYKEKHPKVISLTNQLEATTRKLEEEKDKFYSLQEKALKFKLLKRAAEDKKSLYEGFRTNIQELDISRELIVSNIQIVNEAQPPSKPIKPVPEKDIPQAIVLALFLGVGLCYLLEYLDSTLKTADDIEFYVKVPFLGYIPAAAKDIKEEKEKGLMSTKKAYSQVAEAFRNTRVSLLFASPEDKPIKTLVITSSIPQEGKSFCTSNLGITFAVAKESTVIVDLDLRRGRLAEVFDVKGKEGLSSVLAGMCSWEEVLVKTKISNLFFLPAGTLAPNPTELINSEKLKTILKQLRDRFQRVVIDSPPILSVSDSLILGSQCDGIVFVIKAAATPLKCILEAKKIMEKKIKIIGTILNSVDVRKESYYYYHYHDYYHASEKKS